MRQYWEIAEISVASCATNLSDNYEVIRGSYYGYNTADYELTIPKYTINTQPSNNTIYQVDLPEEMSKTGDDRDLCNDWFDLCDLGDTMRDLME